MHHKQSCQVTLDIPGSSLTFNGAPGNIQGNLDRYVLTNLSVSWSKVITLLYLWLRNCTCAYKFPLIKYFFYMKMNLKCHLQNGGNFKLASMCLWIYLVSSCLRARLDSRGPHSVLCCRFSHWLINRRDNIGSVSWGRNKIDTISHTTFSNAFCWMKIYWFRLKFHLSLFTRVQLMMIQHWFR